MFTGIIEEVGTVERVVPADGGAVLRITAARVLEGSKPGDSISTDGCCLTITKLTGTGFEADCSAETMRLTSIGSMRPGQRVNLERAMALGDRLGGHLVQGHVEGVGAMTGRRPEGDSVMMRFSFPPELGRYLIHKGSVAVSGISLTVAVLGDGWFEVAVIPVTLEWTSLGTLPIGSSVNLETDLIAKYVERLLGDRAPATASPPRSVEALKDMGY